MTSFTGGTFALNTSVSKQKYSFGKVGRFITCKKDLAINAYDQKDYYAKSRDSDTGKGFGSINRFNYYESPKKIEKAPSPATYNLHN